MLGYRSIIFEEVMDKFCGLKRKRNPNFFAFIRGSCFILTHKISFILSI